MKLIVLAAMLTAAAGGPPDAVAVPEAESHRCEELARSTPDLAWWTIYYGERSTTVGGADVREWTREVRCFTSEEACGTWLAWARLTWPDRGFARPCRRGLPPWLGGRDT